MRSFPNALFANAESKKPEVGDGATEICFSDRHAWTVVKVVNAKKIIVQRDNAKRVDKNGFSESQTWEFSPNPEGPTRTLTLRKNGSWHQMGCGMNHGAFLVGVRMEYYDPTF